MKRIILFLTTLIAAMSVAISCKELSNEMDPDYNGTYDLVYCLKSVKQYDPVNVGGIDVYKYFDFFKSLTFTIHFVDEKVSSINFENGSIPFLPYTFNVPSGDIDCYLETSITPYELRIKSNDDVIAYYLRGEFYIPFQLDCEEISYEYRFSSVK